VVGRHSLPRNDALSTKNGRRSEQTRPVRVTVAAIDSSFQNWAWTKSPVGTQVKNRTSFASVRATKMLFNFVEHAYTHTVAVRTAAEQPRLSIT